MSLFVHILVWCHLNTKKHKNIELREHQPYCSLLPSLLSVFTTWVKALFSVFTNWMKAFFVCSYTYLETRSSFASFGTRAEKVLVARAAPVKVHWNIHLFFFFYGQCLKYFMRKFLITFSPNLDVIFNFAVHQQSRQWTGRCSCWYIPYWSSIFPCPVVDAATTLAYVALTAWR